MPPPSALAELPERVQLVSVTVPRLSMPPPLAGGVPERVQLGSFTVPLGEKTPPTRSRTAAAGASGRPGGGRGVCRRRGEWVSFPGPRWWRGPPGPPPRPRAESPGGALLSSVGVPPLKIPPPLTLRPLAELSARVQLVSVSVPPLKI